MQVITVPLSSQRVPVLQERKKFEEQFRGPPKEDLLDHHFIMRCPKHQC
jgi:hypothetical protein